MDFMGPFNLVPVGVCVFGGWLNSAHPPQTLTGPGEAAAPPTDSNWAR